MWGAPAWHARATAGAPTASAPTAAAQTHAMAVQPPLARPQDTAVGDALASGGGRLLNQRGRRRAGHARGRVDLVAHSGGASWKLLQWRRQLEPQHVKGVVEGRVGAVGREVQEGGLGGHGGVRPGGGAVLGGGLGEGVRRTPAERGAGASSVFGDAQSREEPRLAACAPFPESEAGRSKPAKPALPLRARTAAAAAAAAGLAWWAPGA
jgi:hypothetical protein